MFLVVFDPRVNYGDDCYFVSECANKEEVSVKIDEWEKQIRKKYPNAKDFDYKIYEIINVIDAGSFKKAV